MAREPETRLVYSTDAGPAQPARAKRPPSQREEPAHAQQQPAGIRLRLERRASNRVVTVVTGLPGTAADVAALARSLKTACGAGGTLKDGALELQGDHRDKVEAALKARGLASKRAGG